MPDIFDRVTSFLKSAMLQERRNEERKRKRLLRPKIKKEINNTKKVTKSYGVLLLTRPLVKN